MIYAIGDIHGNLGLLTKLLALIKEDAADRGIERPQIVVLGDFIDRGTESKAVIDLFLSPTFENDFKAVILLGNHEDWLLRLLNGDMTALSGWLHHGGAETIESYGIKFGGDAPEKVFERFSKVFPQPHREFLQNCRLTFQHERWFFVHAGVNPANSLGSQHKDDLLWIYTDFLNHKGDYGSVIVHGHAVTQSREVEVFPNRIAVDTGSYLKDGKLSAVALNAENLVKVLSAR